MPIGIKGFQKGHGALISKETYKQMGINRRGIKFSEEHKRKIGIANKNNKTGLENGKQTRFKKSRIHAHDLVGGINVYRNLHKWVEKELGKPNQCSECGKIAYGRQIHWANKSKLYKKDLSDWLRLCVKCHYNFDPNRKILPVNNN